MEVLRRSLLASRIALRKERRCVSSAVELPSEADVVVIGGGSIGCNTLFHLAEAGCTNVVLLESHKLTAGTTWHTAGLLWRLRPNDVDIQIIDRSRELNRSILPEKYGYETGWIENGGLFIASTKERLDEYKRLMTIGRAFGIESHVLDPTETQKLYPHMNVSDVYGSLYSPGDGLIDPSGICTGLSRAAKSMGARVVEDCPVTGIETAVDDFGTRMVSGVKTPFGLIKTKALVNCAGAWAPKIGQMCGVPVPLCSMRHAYVITDTIEGIKGMPNVRDHDSSIYLRLQGDALAVGGYEPNPEFINDLSDDFAFSLYDLNYDVFGVHIDKSINRVPQLGHVGIKSEVCGPESFTADHKALLGESPSLRGFFLGCGFNSAGMMYGGGCGQQLAKWIMNGRPDFFMQGFDIRRFYSGLVTDGAWVKERSHESYAKNYSIVFPYDEPLAARNRRTDPFHEVMLADGCVYQERLGYERPGWFLTEPLPKHDAGRTENIPTGDLVPVLLPYDYYGSYDHQKHENYLYKQCLQLDYTFDTPKSEHFIDQECHACRNDAALFNMSYFGKYVISGRDSQKLVDWVFTADMQKPVDSTIYTCILNRLGGIEADLTVSMVHEDSLLHHSGADNQKNMSDNSGCNKSFYVAVGGGIAEHVLAHIKREMQEKQFDVVITDITEQFGLLSLQGPKSREILQKLTDTDLADESVPFSKNTQVQVCGRDCLLIRLSFVRELGYELHIPKESCVDVYRGLMAAGRDLGLKNAGYRAIDALSLEKGYRLWGLDIRNDVTPVEASLIFTCKLKSEVDFCGRTEVERHRAEGARKKIALFSLENPSKRLWGLETLYRDGEVVGYLQRADFAPVIGKPIGIAYVTKPDGGKVTNAWLTKGTYELEIIGERFPATLHLKSPFDPEGNRLKGIYTEAS